MRGRWWGRSLWRWVAEVVIVGLVVAAFVLNDEPALRFVAVLLLVSRVLRSGLVVYRDRAERRAADDARDDGVLPPQ